VAQRISLIEKFREITPDILAHYLPAHQMQRGLALVGNTAQKELPVEELKMLYNMIGMMKREMDMMKEQLAALQQQDAHSSIQEDIMEWEPKKKVLDIDEVAVVADEETETPTEETKTDLKLSNLERDTIQKALLKNGGNRKATAVELGLSERTLYRKIKDYGL
jgi:transcriptional regulator with PAS, ATPase and Fis domain